MKSKIKEAITLGIFVVGVVALVGYVKVTLLYDKITDKGNQNFKSKYDK